MIRNNAMHYQGTWVIYKKTKFKVSLTVPYYYVEIRNNAMQRGTGLLMFLQKLQQAA
jgi:hypothetical protein